MEPSSLLDWDVDGMAIEPICTRFSCGIDTAESDQRVGSRESERTFSAKENLWHTKAPKKAAEHHEHAVKEHKAAAGPHAKGDHEDAHEQAVKTHEHSTQAHANSGGAHQKSLEHQ
jgi:hypothetical protein